MIDRMRSDLILEMSKGIDDILLDWHPQPSLSEVIAAQVQALARAISATTNRGQSLTDVKDHLDALVTEIHKHPN